MSVVTSLGLALPVVAAPMAGGPGTPSLVAAAAAAGSLGFLAAGYKTAEALAAEMAAVRQSTDRFGVNVFAPNPLPVEPAEFRRYVARIAPDAARYGVDVTGAQPLEDDDHWQDKIDLLLAIPVPIVSFTFGLPAPAVVRALQAAGSVVVQTVTAVDEAVAAADVGVDALAVQAAAAGGHSGTLHPLRPLRATPLPDLTATIARTVDLPLLAAGGIATTGDVRAVIRAGAAAAVVGTALLRAAEAGTSAVHRTALSDHLRTTVLTHAFTGRPARGLHNEFIASHEAVAPIGYPALHHLTSPLRKAAAAAGDPERVNLWAGTGFRAATDAPLADIMARLVSNI